MLGLPLFIFPSGAVQFMAVLAGVNISNRMTCPNHLHLVVLRVITISSCVGV